MMSDASGLDLRREWRPEFIIVGAFHFLPPVLPAPPLAIPSTLSGGLAPRAM